MKLRKQRERIKGFLLGIVLGTTIFTPLIVYAKGIHPVKQVVPQVQASVAEIEKATLPKPVVVIATPSVAQEEVINLIKKYSAEYSVPENLALDIARCESGYNSTSKNSHSSATGVYQFLSGTWTGTRLEMGLDSSPQIRLDAEENVKTAMWKIAHGGVGAWGDSKGCWSPNVRHNSN